MWQRFTERARRVILLAQEEARKMASGAVDTEHLLLGVIRDADSVAAQVLQKMGVALSQVRADVEATATTEAVDVETPSTGEPKLTPKAKRVLELAADEARRMKHNYIGSEHLLLALLRERDGLAADVLRKLGINLEKARKQVEEYLGPTDDGTFPSPKVQQAEHSKAHEVRPLVPAERDKTLARIGGESELQRFITMQDAQIDLLQAHVRLLKGNLQMIKVLTEEKQHLPSPPETTNESTWDFSNVRSLMQSTGTSLVFVGEGKGEQDALDAVQEIVSAPLFESCIGDARKLFVNVSAGNDLAIGEVEDIVRAIREASTIEEDKVFWGITFNPELQGSIRVTVFATGFDRPKSTSVVT